ncbi:hypothetical protein CLAFUW4_07370 [Fulvia fulva]|nr:uncharacterized protein CLAFUR5_20239 [Fulvia fulva]KAK4621877.1 hypothetical protein CLAFUR4_07377 [Fulvia fulva]KAK4622496.1 hypothetical protein CLAFUR0_07375 [Fulvia fulva]WMI38945.1 hypothetical protein CLAFUR5_20239 [Fulvia fulva]WPV16133.1 hypothetical protein CLAFUW4_07370 [Fulvia fulva]WPV31177.1 hypothetical protein CLAFUW7_07372 [Fulvia fulva]
MRSLSSAPKAELQWLPDDAVDDVILHLSKPSFLKERLISVSSTWV